MRALVFDSGPVITLAMNDLLWVLSELKKRFIGEFLISNDVKNEIVDRPITSKKYKFEALRILNLIEEGGLKIYDGDLKRKTDILMELANNMFFGKGRPIVIVQRAEIESLALASSIQADAVVIDERTTRLLLENPKKLAALLTRKLNTDVAYNSGTYREFQNEAGKMNVLRSVDLVTIAYELGMLNRYLFKPELKKTLLEGVLWGTKLNGCSVSREEIDDIIRMEGF